MEQIKTIVSFGKYKFEIIDNTLSLRGETYCRNLKIGGNVSDCVNISISYKNNQPNSATIPHVFYDPECSIGVPLDRGEGSVAMIKALLDYFYKNIPTIREVSFEDKSNIDCATDIEIEKGSRFRKKGTNVYPIPLYYFSIAFNGKTWYEQKFNARQKDANKHMAYKEKIDILLHSEDLKTKTTFLEFLQTAQPSAEIVSELENYYSTSITFGDFFTSMPKIDRCRLVRGWISTFMSYHLKDVFENMGWIIELPIATKGGKRNTRKYYCPRGRIIHNKTYKDFGIDG